MAITGFFETRNLALRIGEHLGVKLKVTPMECLHPETIKVEHFDWNISSIHPFQE
jgi:hypothetical protein